MHNFRSLAHIAYLAGRQPLIAGMNSRGGAWVAQSHPVVEIRQFYSLSSGETLHESPIEAAGLLDNDFVHDLVGPFDLARNFFRSLFSLFARNETAELNRAVRGSDFNIRELIDHIPPQRVFDA